MREKSLALLFALLVLFAGAPRLLQAEELCPGCYGRGNTGCGRCTGAGIGAFIGKCSNCSGMFGGMGLRPGERCQPCHGTGICPGCNGRGSPCLVCKGSGRVPDGTAKAIAEADAKAQREGLAKHLGRFKALVGRWKLEAETKDRGKFTSEVRCTMVLDDSFLRWEERAQYESGAVVECVSYVTYSASRSSYVWVLGFSPGRLLQIDGRATDTGVVWEFVDNNGLLNHSTWTLKPEEKRLEIKDERMEEGEWVSSGSGVATRTGEPGGAVLKGSAEPDEAATAVLDGMKPLRFLEGAFTGAGESAEGKTSSSSTWRHVLDGTVLELDATSKRPDGTTSRERWFLTWLPQESKYQLVAFLPQGQILIFNGTRNEAGDEITFDLNGPRIVWKLDPEEARIHWTVDQKDGEEWKTIEKGMDAKK